MPYDQERYQMDRHIMSAVVDLNGGANNIMVMDSALGIGWDRKVTITGFYIKVTEAINHAGFVVELDHTPSGGARVTKSTITLTNTGGTQLVGQTQKPAITFVEFDCAEGDLVHLEHVTAQSATGECRVCFTYRETPA